MRLASPPLYSPTVLLSLFLLLVALPLLTSTSPLPQAEAERIVESTAERIFPEWSRGSGWLGFRVIEHEAHDEPALPESMLRAGHLVNSPIRGVVTEDGARLRLGITARELDVLFERRILNRQPPREGSSAAVVGEREEASSSVTSAGEQGRRKGKGKQVVREDAEGQSSSWIGGAEARDQPTTRRQPPYRLVAVDVDNDNDESAAAARWRSKWSSDTAELSSSFQPLHTPASDRYQGTSRSSGARARPPRRP